MISTNPILILREEIICLIVLIYLAFISRSFRMGKDGKIFNLIMSFAIVHVVTDGLTTWTVNHMDRVAPWFNDLAHIVFYLSAILFSTEILVYVFNMCRPNRTGSFRKTLLAIDLVYLALVAFGVLAIQYEPFDGTYASVGPAPMVGFVICFLYFANAIIMILRNRRQIGKHIRMMLLPMLFLLIAVEGVQMIVKEFLFTGATITVITVGFFFSLENPAAVLERKVMMDAMSGLRSRSSYENDMIAYDQEFLANKDTRFTFVFIDINNLRSVNGLFGHQEGDSYISNMAVLLMMNLKGAEHLYRMGGDEFLAIYRKADEKTVVRDIKRVHEACQREGEKKDYTPELAIGYAVSDPKYSTLRDVLRVADYMMYRNKADIKREIAVGAMRHEGTHLNLSGLTDRVFDAMCLTSEGYYPYICNMETNITRIAPGMADFFGIGSEFVSDFANVWMEHVHPDDREGYAEDVSAAMRGQKDYHYYRYRAKAKDGNYVEVSCRGGMYHGRDGEPDIFAGYIVNHGAPQTVDPATGLKNYIKLFEKLNEAARQKSAAVVMKLDTTNTNRVRMLYGSRAAAMLAQSLGDIFRKAVNGKGEVYSRSGGNFFFYLPDTDEAQVNDLYRQIRETCAGGVMAGDAVIPIGVSAGAVAIPADNLKDAEAIRGAAMYAAEEAFYSPADTVVFYQNDLVDMKEEEMQLLKAVHQDCIYHRDRFFLRFQPIVDAQSGEVTGAEALLRYQSPELGEVQPGQFISFLENDPGYAQLGYDIIRMAVRGAIRIRRKLPEFRISVNMTALQLCAEDFLPSVLKILKEERYPADALILELTERCKEIEFELLRKRVAELRAAGIRAALDDMGTGFSTIDLLLHLPVDEIKLDMTFTAQIRENQGDSAFAANLAETAARNRMDLCFEGVETEEMRDYLKGFGKVMLQGYYFAKPLKLEEFEKKYCF